MHCEAIGDNFKDTFECKDHHKRIFDIFLKFKVKEWKKYLRPTVADGLSEDNTRKIDFVGICKAWSTLYFSVMNLNFIWRPLFETKFLVSQFVAYACLEKTPNSHTYTNSHTLFCLTKMWLFGYVKAITRKISLK